MHFHFHFRHHSDPTYLRNFIFGVEDSLVSTVGLLAGVASADMSRPALLTTGLVLIVVEGFSMGIGSYLTEETAEEMDGTTPHPLVAAKGGLTMLASYILSGLLPLSPYAFLPGNQAVVIGMAIGKLFHL